jgi:hypothetical protein
MAVRDDLELVSKPSIANETSAPDSFHIVAGVPVFVGSRHARQYDGAQRNGKLQANGTRRNVFGTEKQ